MPSVNSTSTVVPAASHQRLFTPALIAGITAAATAVHVVAFDWLTRCGVVLPLAFALGYAVARFARTRRDHVLGLAAIVLL